MWFEILPSFLVIYGAMTVGLTGGCLIMSAIHEKPFNKALMCNSDIHHHVRDQRLTGDAYKPQGLEAIKDEDSSCK